MDQLASEVDSSFQGYITTAEASLWPQQLFHPFPFGRQSMNQGAKKYWGS